MKNSRPVSRNLNAREEKINAGYCLHVCDWRLRTSFIGITLYLRAQFQQSCESRGPHSRSILRLQC